VLLKKENKMHATELRMLAVARKFFNKNACYCQIMLAIKIKCFNKMLYILSAVEKRN
jgi:hypothetical protein